jgi:hypothetical protein
MEDIDMRLSTFNACTIAVFATLVFSAPFATASSSAGYPPSLAESVRGTAEVALEQLPGIDLAKVEEEDLKREQDGMAPRFAVPMDVNLFPTATTGTWDTLSDGRVIWRHRISSFEALSLNFGFTRFHLPPTAELWLYTTGYDQILGPFTENDNDAHRQLWTPVLLAEEAVLELAINPEFLPYLELELTQVGHGYTGFGYPATNDRSGSCNLDVICGAADGFPQVDAWRDQIRSVAVISTGGSTFCTGFLVNYAGNDVKGFFMTANHCGISSGNAASLVTYWNYENSWCREPDSAASGQPGDGTLDQFSTGSTFRAGYSTSDVTLVELDDPIDPSAAPYFAGWDNTSADATSAVAIHQPNTDEKRISFEDDPTATSTYLGTSVPGDGTHVWVDDWDLGTTEPGSSGSPLFDQNHRVVGQLHGGYAACGNDESDWYGRFSVSWTGGGSDSSRLSNWLDPDVTGVTQLDGRDLCTPPTFDFTISPNPATAGELVTFDAINVTGTGPFTYAWDFDDDLVTDCTTDPCTHTYSAYFNGNVTLTVTDVGESCAGSLSKAMVVNAPSVEYLSTGTPYELCGDADSIIEPGEEWAVPVTVTNVGNMAGTNVMATVSVFGAPSEVVMTADMLDFGAVAAGADATADFSFGIDPAFSPCGATIQFDLSTVTWTGGSNPGIDDVFTAATGGGTGTQVVMGDDFENAGTWYGLGDPAVVMDQWVVTTGPGPHTGGEWVRAAGGSQGQPGGSTGYFAVADSDGAGSGSTTSTILYSPVVDLSGVLSGTTTIDFDAFYNSIGDSESADVDVWDGGAWQNVVHWTGTDVDAHQSIDVSAHALANPEFRVRFSYQNATWDWWFAIDNFEVIVPVNPVCDNTEICDFGSGLFADGFESGDTSLWSVTNP